MRPQARFGGFDALLIGFVKGETACGAFAPAGPWTV
jgi:hypothetical protein